MKRILRWYIARIDYLKLNVNGHMDKICIDSNEPFQH